MYSITVAARDEAELGAVLGALKGCGLSNVRVGLNPITAKPSPDPAPRTPTPATTPNCTGAPAAKVKRSRTYAGGKQEKGISAVELFLEVVAREPRVYSIEEIENEFVKREFSATSAGPTGSMLAKTGRVKRVASGRYCIPGLTIHKPER